MQHARRGVEDSPDAMAAEIAHHREAVRLGVALDGAADIAQGRAGAYRANTAHHGLIGYVHQLLCLHPDPSDREHPTGIAVPAVEDNGDVDIEDVTFG